MANLTPISIDTSTMDYVEPPAISRLRSISSRHLASTSEAESLHSPRSSRNRARKKSFDTSDILYKLPEIRERYFHKDCWTDTNGDVFQGPNPNAITITNNNNNMATDVEQRFDCVCNETMFDEKESQPPFLGSPNSSCASVIDNINCNTTHIGGGGQCSDNLTPCSSLKLAPIAAGNAFSEQNSKKKAKNCVKKVIFLEIKIKRISKIDTATETFRCRFHYYLTWLATKDEYVSFLRDKYEYLPHWSPTLEWTNAAEIHEHTIGTGFTIKTHKNVGFSNEWRICPKYLGFLAQKGKWNRVRFEADVTFAEELELEAFPFDCQDLTFYMKIEKSSILKCDIVPFPREGDFVLLDPQFSVLSEWYLENLVTEFGYTDPLKSKSLRCYSLVSVHIKASRRWEAHVGVLIVTFCMFSLGLGTFSMQVLPEQLGERLGFCVTFLLADVATLQLMFVHLPNIPYWTILDFYIYTSFIFLFIITIWSCLAGAMEFLEDLDVHAFWAFLTIYLVLHCGYIGASIYYRTSERLKLTMTSSQLNKHFQGTRAVADRRAISNTWDQSILSDNDSHMHSDATTFCFEGNKLEPVSSVTQVFKLK